MASQGITPVDEGTMLFGGAFDGEFIPELFRTRHDRPFEPGQIVILETLGKTDGFWIDINRTAVIGKPSAEYQALHDTVRDGYLTLLEHMKPGFHTGKLGAHGAGLRAAHGACRPPRRCWRSRTVSA